MCRLAGIAALVALAGCAGVDPGVPMMMGANEMQQGPGLFSGPAGQVTLYGGKDWPADDPVERELDPES
ncbi:hypothetical protein [Tropicimonas sp. IMCC34043]|uniref:hypothetical protein n=1 Tax=Tropicimonas sp. IMCC34043 TaxID=2248760 RepID=UPI000E28446B|nr:hypothetical protein [Tropicimonas sp. IMCC34043]